MVRLKVQLCRLVGRLRHLFQFQYGAIKSAVTQAVAKYGIMFQFQYGAIKSLVLLNLKAF